MIEIENFSATLVYTFKVLEGFGGRTMGVEANSPFTFLRHSSRSNP